MSTYEQVHVDAPPAATVSALREALRTRGITEYAVVNHGHVFGSPAGGAKLLARSLPAAVDIPLRLAVIDASDGGSEIVLRDMRTLLGEELGDLADAFTGVLRSLAGDAQDSLAGR